MNHDTSPSGVDIAVEKPFEPTLQVHAGLDLETVLLEGLPDAPASSSDDPGGADFPDLQEPPAALGEATSAGKGSVFDIEALLLDGLSVPSSASAAPADESDLPGDPAQPVVAENAVPEGVEPAAAPDAGFETALLEDLSDAPAPPDEAVSAGEGSVFDIEALLLDGLSDVSPVSSAAPDGSDRPGDSAPTTVPENALLEGAEPAEVPDAGFESALFEGLSDAPSSSSDDPGVAEFPDFSELIIFPDEAVSAPEGSVSDIEALLLDGLSVPSPASSAPPDAEIASAGAAPEPGFPSTGIDAKTDGAPGERAADGPSAALAFAADLETEEAFREGLLHIEDLTPDYDDPQVWPGGLRAAVAALGEGHTTRLVIVDIDGSPYPAGAIHELAEVCEIGTSVIAVGSDDTARVNREIMLAGVSDYLVKPVTAQTVRDAASRAITSERELPARGRVAGFVGTGGSGTTTVATAMALHAAEQGRYVSILDLNRTVSAMALLLDVEPAPGLDQLFDAAGETAPDPQMLDGVRAARSERISVYAYRLGPSAPPVPSPPALNWLLGQLRHRSQLVLVDGLDDPELHFSLLAEADARVLVAEPTAGGAVRTAHILDLLGDGPPVLLVQNHTRAFKAGAGARLLLDAGVETSPDVVIPYEASLPEVADRGWPRGRLPRRLREPVAGLWEGLLACTPGEHTVPAGVPRGI